MLPYEHENLTSSRALSSGRCLESVGGSFANSSSVANLSRKREGREVVLLLGVWESREPAVEDNLRATVLRVCSVGCCCDPVQVVALAEGATSVGGGTGRKEG